MTSTDFTITPKTAKPKASMMRFDNYPHSNGPASANFDRGRSMPAPWQTRGTPQAVDHHKYGAPARSFGDILSDPFRPLVSSSPRKVALGAAVLLAVLILIF